MSLGYEKIAEAFRSIGSIDHIILQYNLFRQFNILKSEVRNCIAVSQSNDYVPN